MPYMKSTNVLSVESHVLGFWSGSAQSFIFHHQFKQWTIMQSLVNRSIRSIIKRSQTPSRFTTSTRSASLFAISQQRRMRHSHSHSHEMVPVMGPRQTMDDNRFYDPHLMNAEQQALIWDLLNSGEIEGGWPEEAEEGHSHVHPMYDENYNPETGEYNGPKGPEPTRYGDWERKGRVSDF